MKNVVDEYLNYKKKYIKKICCLLYSFASPSIISNYIDVYIDFFYYHKLSTLNECNLYNMSNFNKELQGKFHEIIYDGKASQKETTVCFYVAFFTFLIENKKIESKEQLSIFVDNIKKINPCFNFIKPDISALFEEMKKYNIVNEKFINCLEDERFSLTYEELETDVYYLKLDYRIPKLNKFKKAIVKSTYASDKVKYGKALTTINLLNHDIICSIPCSNAYPLYFVSYPLINSAKGNNLYDSIVHSLNDNIILVLDRKDYLKNKTLANKLKRVFKLCIKDSVKNVQKIDDHLKKLDSFLLFDYIVITNAGNRADEIKQYKSKTGKKIYVKGD